MNETTELPVTSAEIKETVLGLTDLAAWPEIAGLFDARSHPVRLDWQLPALACLAVGGQPTTALPAVAAIACLQISIILVDDILDQDPRGEYHRIGYGRAANIALALQAAATAFIENAAVDSERRSLASVSLARAALRTARGQDLDVQNLAGEENYWRVVKTKSTPFYGSALEIGAILGGASPQVAQALYEVGVLFGEMIQVFDDLLDAFDSPAGPDWREGRNNLSILYARTADHPYRARFAELLGLTDDPTALAEAQEILIRSGAVSYCVYLLFQRYTAASRSLARLSLRDPSPLVRVLEGQISPVKAWLDRRGLTLPASPGAEPR